MSVISPATETELCEAVAAAAAARAPLEIRGGGSRAALGRPVQADKTVSLGAMGRITRYEPEALTLVCEAGTPVSEIETVLNAEGQLLPFEPMDHRALLGAGDAAPTIGGVVACGVSGPRRLVAGGCRDSLIGVRFVNGSGEAIVSGGRVMKNVTGYDLVKLLCGSFGTLGVLTEVSFKLLPKPETTATLVYEGLSDVDAVRLMASATTSPYSVTGAAHAPAGVEGAEARTYLRLEGFAASVAERVEKLTRHLAPATRGDLMSDATSQDAWRGIRDAVAFAQTPGAVWRISIRPSAAPDVVAALRASMEVAAFYDWAGGLIWLRAPDEGDAGASAVRAETAKAGGVATLVRASEATRAAVDVFTPPNGVMAKMTRGLRDAFDPAGVLNPGRMGA